MITAVDTSILFDVCQEDACFGEQSSQALRTSIQNGRVVVCEVVLAELAAGFPSQDALERRLSDLCIEFLPMTLEAACYAGSQWKEYIRRGGTRSRLIGDFMIAAHAEKQCDRLLTRDRGFYRKCFSTLQIAEPAYRT
jgi:hypothetical protein